VSVVALLDSIDRDLGGLQVVRRLSDHRDRGTRRRDYGDCVTPGGQPVDRALGEQLRLVQMGLRIGSVGFVGHRVAVVDHDHVQPRSASGKAGQRRVLAADRPGQRQPEEQQHAASHRQQQPLLEPQAAAVLPQRLQQEGHRRPVHRPEAAAIQNVDNDWDRSQRQPRGKKGGGDEAHRQGREAGHRES
jgi:hypothetical protein